MENKINILHIFLIFILLYLIMAYVAQLMTH